MGEVVTPRDPLADLAAGLREEAALFRRRGLEREARLEESIAEDVEAAVRDYRREELTVAEAAAESGYSEKSLRRMVREGRIPDRRPSGSQGGAIRIRRRDLPRKPGAERDAVSDAVARHVDRAGGFS